MFRMATDKGSNLCIISFETLSSVYNGVLS